MLSPSYLRERTQENRERLARLHAECLHRALERHIAHIEMYAPVEAKQGKTYVISDNIRHSMVYDSHKVIPTKYVHKWITKHLKAYFTKCGFTCKRHGDRVIVSWRKVRKEKIQGGYEMLITVADYQNEIARVQAALNNTDSPKQKRDYGKYIKRLKRELAAAQEHARRKEQ